MLQVPIARPLSSERAGNPDSRVEIDIASQVRAQHPNQLPT